MGHLVMYQQMKLVMLLLDVLQYVCLIYMHLHVFSKQRRDGKPVAYSPSKGTSTNIGGRMVSAPTRGWDCLTANDALPTHGAPTAK